MKHLNLILKTVAALAVSFLFGAAICVAADVPQYAVTVGCVTMSFNLIPMHNAYHGAFYTITATDVVTEWGALFRSQGQSVQDIINKFQQKSVTEAYFPVRLTDNTVMEKSTASFAKVLQAFQKAYTPKGGVTFEPVKIPLYKLKIDLAEYPDELEETWLGFLTGEGLDRTQWPFMKWFLDGALSQAEEDLENDEIYKGVRVAPTPGTPNPAGNNIQGVKKQLNTMNVAGDLDLKAMGAVPTTDGVELVDYVEDMTGMTNRLLRNQIDYWFMSEDLRDLFRDGMREKYNVNYESIPDSSITKMRNDNIQIIGLPSHAGSTKIWGTPKFNRQAGFKRTKNQGVFKVEAVDRQVKAYTDYSKGYGFWVPQYVVSNDVELT